MDFEGKFPCYTRRGPVKITGEKFEEFLMKIDEKTNKNRRKVRGRGHQNDRRWRMSEIPGVGRRAQVD